MGSQKSTHHTLTTDPVPDPANLIIMVKMNNGESFNNPLVVNRYYSNLESNY